MTRPVNKQTNRLVRLHKLDPYPDGDCLLHAINFNVLTMALSDSFSLTTELSILRSGYLRELKAAARAHGIHLRIPISAHTLRDQLLAVLRSLTLEGGDHPKDDAALMKVVHWGVWQKISGMALRKLANHAVQKDPHLIEEQLYRDFVLALSQQVLQTRYPECHFPTSTDRFDDLLKSPACQQLIDVYLQQYWDLFPVNMTTAADLQAAQTAIMPLTTLAVDGDVSQCDPVVLQTLQETWGNSLFPQWLATYADERHLNFEMLGDEHSQVLSELWKVNFLQIDQNPRSPQAKLTSLNATSVNPDYDHFIVQQRSEHYVAGISLGDHVVESMIESVVADRQHYDASGNRVASRFGRWDEQGFTPAISPETVAAPAQAHLPGSTVHETAAADADGGAVPELADATDVTAPAAASVPVSPVVHLVEDEQTQALFRRAIAEELKQRAATPAVPDSHADLTAQGPAVQLQLELDEALADYIQTHQPDDNTVLDQALQNARTPAAKKAVQHAADLKLEREFYQHLATSKEAKYGTLYQRVGLLGRQLHSSSMPGDGRSAASSPDSISTTVTDWSRR